jgi:adenylosuccinate lyase
MRAMAERADYQELLAENEKVMSKLSREELDSCFTLEYYLKNVDFIFRRAGIIE